MTKNITSRPSKQLKLAILFWFYKEPEVCENRLQLLKKTNPYLKIFGLFGGKQKEAGSYRRQLGKELDDFYVSPYKSAAWKWINGDLMLLEWFRARGQFLKWDSIVVIQWDMLVFDSLSKLFRGIKKDEIFLSGLRPITKKIENRWDWTKPGAKERRNYLRFLEYVRKNYNYRQKPVISLFILQVFPRVFFEKYLTVKNPKIGMLEYKVPVYAKIFGLPVYRKNFGVLWDEGKKNRPLNAVPNEIKESYIRRQLARKNGWRIFHPYYGKWRAR